MHAISRNDSIHADTIPRKWLLNLLTLTWTLPDCLIIPTTLNNPVCPWWKNDGYAAILFKGTAKFQYEVNMIEYCLVCMGVRGRLSNLWQHRYRWNGGKDCSRIRGHFRRHFVLHSPESWHLKHSLTVMECCFVLWGLKKRMKKYFCHQGLEGRALILNQASDYPIIRRQTIRSSVRYFQNCRQTVPWLFKDSQG